MTERSIPGLARRSVQLLLAPPRAVFYGVHALLAGGLLWIGSSPGVPLIPLMGFGWLVVIGALIWACKLGAHLKRRRGGAAPSAARWFLAAPVGGVIVAALLTSGLAFDVRWALSRSSFDEAVAAVTDPADTSTPSPGRIGLYRFPWAPQVIGDAVVFHHPLGGGLFDDAGFAYLPAGPTAEVEGAFESLRTERIEGAWYRWWSSW